MSACAIPTGTRMDAGCPTCGHAVLAHVVATGECEVCASRPRLDAMLEALVVRPGDRLVLTTTTMAPDEAESLASFLTERLGDTPFVIIGGATATTERAGDDV